MSFMVISVVVMMFTVSPLLAVVALLTVPISFGLISLVMKKSQPQFKAQWKITSELIMATLKRVLLVMQLSRRMGKK